MTFVQSIGVDNILLVEAWDTTADFSTPDIAFTYSVAIPGVTASYFMVETDTGTFSTATDMKIYSVLQSDKTNIDYL